MTMMMIPPVVFSRGLLALQRTRVCLAASYLIRCLSTTLLGVGHHRVAALYVFKLAYGQRAVQNYVSLQDPSLPVSPSASRPLFFRLFNADQVLSARSRFYCTRTRDPKEGKMGEGLRRNVVTTAGEIKASKGFSFKSQFLFSASDPNH